IVIKKSIVKALREEVNPDYLLTVESDLWREDVFYRNVTAFPNIDDVLRETSGFKGVHNPIVFDGDKIERDTGRRISDVPGTAIVVYDGRTVVNRTLNYKEFQIIDGDKIWVETGKPFDFVPEGRVIVYDCLFHTIFNCGRKKEDRVSVFPKTIYMGNGERKAEYGVGSPTEKTPAVEADEEYSEPETQAYVYDQAHGFWWNTWHKLKSLPWYAKVFYVLLVLFIIHLLLTIFVREWGVERGDIHFPSDFPNDEESETF
ncbi:MAG TPA: hypothetical protein VIT68_05230, partial [Candidatus Gracilibacteria bacterium]